MFDRTVIMPARTETRYVATDVHEHRAPTDASVRLLSEMEDKARERIVDRMLAEAGDNKIGAVSFTEMCATQETRVAFTLNGEKFDVRLHSPIDTSSRERAMAYAKAIGDAVGEQIATRMMIEFRAWR